MKITKKFVQKRICRDTVTILTPKGPDSPLSAIEPTILELILAMAEIRDPLQPSRCILLINDLMALLNYPLAISFSLGFAKLEKKLPSGWREIQKKYCKKRVNSMKKPERLTLNFFRELTPFNETSQIGTYGPPRSSPQSSTLISGRPMDHCPKERQSWLQHIKYGAAAGCHFLSESIV